MDSNDVNTHFETLDSIPRACATVSIGTTFLPGGRIPLREKLISIAKAGFTGTELAIWDLQPFAADFLGTKVGLEDYDQLCQAGEEVRRFCTGLGLKIIVMVACFQIEGWPKGSYERQKAFHKIRQFKRLMKSVGTETLLVAASDADNISLSEDELATDIALAADILHEDGYRLAYEDLCWATAAPTWISGWKLVLKADRDNIGLCLDTFHIAGYEWADPTTSSGVRDDIDIAEKFSQSLRNLARTVPPEKIFLFQIGDAYRLGAPFSQGDGEPMKPRERWAQTFRPLPCGHGGFLPVEDVMCAVFETGYRGWCSVEIFDGGPSGSQPRNEQPDRQAADAMSSLSVAMADCANRIEQELAVSA